MITVCGLEDLPPGESVRVTEGVPTPVAVFRTEDGEVYAIDDACTHQDASLSDGFLEGCFVECPLHEAFFDLRTGRPTCPPAKKPVRTYDVSVVDGCIQLQIAVREPA